jgi:hypothetical protein
MLQFTTRDRRFAAGAGLAVLAGALIMLVALVAAPGSWLAGYVSEAGTTGRPFAGAYRCGLILLASGVACLAAAWRQVPAVAALLGVAAVLAGTSGAVPCTSGCPLPPYQQTTVANVVHTLAGIAGMVTLAAAMLAVVLVAASRRAVRRLAIGAAALTVPMGIALGLTMLFVGRGTLGADLERVLLVIAVSWLIGTALLTLLRNSVKVEPWQIPPSATVSPRSSGSSPS